MLIIADKIIFERRHGSFLLDKTVESLKYYQIRKPLRSQYNRRNKFLIVYIFINNKILKSQMIFLQTEREN